MIRLVWAMVSRESEFITYGCIGSVLVSWGIKVLTLGNPMCENLSRKLNKIFETKYLYAHL